MRLLEHQGKKFLAEFGLATTQPVLLTSAEAAGELARSIGGPVVLKAQVPFGGRGKAGAVKFASTPEEATQAAQALLGMELKGVRVDQISLEAKVEFKRELYVGMAWDTAAKLPIALLSDAGGVEVEGAHRMIRRTFDPWHGLRAFEGREMAGELNLSGKLLTAVSQCLAQLSVAFLAGDAMTLEINPLVETSEGVLLGLDAHMEVDDDAAYRQKSRLASMGAEANEAVGARAATALEIEARRIDAMDHRGVAGRVVEFDGELALLIGGGGASLTVFDAIRRHGGKPANYCEVGGNPTEEKVAALTALLLSKPGVRHMAVIMNVVNNTRADVMARGVVMGTKKAGLKPGEAIRVFRIPGSWEQEARELLAAEGIQALGREISLDEAARLACKGAK